MKYLLTLIFTLLFSISIHATTFTVINTNDGGAGSLRQSITDANTNQGTDTIIFNISSGHQTIYPLGSLPEITSPVIIDGTTQPGYGGTPIIEINGSRGNGRGLFITAGNSTVKGLNINSFSGSIGIYLDKLGGNIIEGNFIGTDITGTLRPGYQSIGIYIYHSDNNLVGGTTTAARNVISGNNATGISIVYSKNNKVSGNLIGTDLTGNQSI